MSKSKQNRESISVKAPPGFRAAIEKLAFPQEKSVNRWILEAITSQMPAAIAETLPMPRERAGRPPKENSND